MSVVDTNELYMLLLIYKDLAQRSPNLLLSREAFNSYFKILVCRIVIIKLGNMGRINIQQICS